MANVITFHLFVDCTEDKAEAIASRIACYEADIAASFNSETEAYAIVGETRNSITSSMLLKNDPDSIKALSEEYDCTFEIYGYDESEPEWIEHYIFSKGKLMYKYLDSYFFDDEDSDADQFDANQYEDGILMTPEDRKKYEYNKDDDVYILKEEYANENSKWAWDEENGIMQISLKMPYSIALEEQIIELKKNDQYSDTEENGSSLNDWIQSLTKAREQEENSIGADENGFVIKSYPESETTILYNYLGEKSKIVIPDKVTELMYGCFDNNSIITEVIFPDTFEGIIEMCLNNCRNLQKVVIPSNVEVLSCFKNCPSLVIYTPSGSEAESYAKEKQIPYQNI